MKYLLSLKLIAIVCVLSCSKPERIVPGEPVKVIIWEFGGLPGMQAWTKQAVGGFNASRDDIEIELEQRDWATQRESLISTTILGDGPDIVRVHHKYSVEFGQLGGLYPLDSFADFPKVKDLILDNVWEQVSYDGRYYGVPVTMAPFILAVNTSILSENGLEVPETWEDFEELGNFLAKKGIHVFTMPGGVNLDTAYRFLPLLMKAGGRVFDRNWTRATFNGSAGVAALEFLVNLKKSGFMPAASAAYRFDENAAHWSSGKAALSIEGPWWQNATSGNYGFDLSNLALAPVPRPSKKIGDSPSATLLDVFMMSITGYTPVPEYAWEVMKTLYVEDPVWRAPNPDLGGIPTQKAAYENGIESDYIGLDVMAEEGENAVGWPGHPSITEIQRHIADAVNIALVGTMTPKEALDQAAESVNEILGDY
ncbi:MAG: sugar ABC transporter substrate-binding protein [Candidatus Latescibacterota bacterium]|nr:sugar ABC transporter substrate-binding protein [Candidatus Latescibacterota bacterium]